jgi:hypothetical protein
VIIFSIEQYANIEQSIDIENMDTTDDVHEYIERVGGLLLFYLSCQLFSTWLIVFCSLDRRISIGKRYELIVIDKSHDVVELKRVQFNSMQYE